MIAENLKKIRQEFNLSVAKFADKIEIPAMTLTSYERKERVPSANLFIQLYNKLNVNLNWLVSGQGEMFNEPAPQNEQLESLVAQIVNKELKKGG